MANREALRDLQARLASRLQTAKTEGLAISWLAVRIGGQDCLLPLAQSGEIFPLPPVQPVPYAQHWFLGVANLRGGLYGVADLAAFVLALDAHAHRRVILELTQRHPLAAMAPLWRYFWDLERPEGPTAADAVGGGFFPFESG